MTRIEIPLPPPGSNQTPIMFQGVPQNITTWYPHTTPNIDNYQGIPQHIRTAIRPGAGPDTYRYAGKKMSLGVDAGSLLGGLAVGFILGAIVFTATGRKLATATGERVAYHIAPKR